MHLDPKEKHARLRATVEAAVTNFYESGGPAPEAMAAPTRPLISYEDI
jgi:hypothetical protein